MTVTLTRVPSKEQIRQRSTRKAEGATSQILVANALKYSFLQITLKFEKSSMQIDLTAELEVNFCFKFLGKCLLNEK